MCKHRRDDSCRREDGRPIPARRAHGGRQPSASVALTCAGSSGSILRANEPMLEFVRSLGFVLEDDPEDPAQVNATLALG